MSPTARSLAHLRELGYIAQVVEKWNPYAKIRVDLFGVIDIVAVKGTENGVLGVQATSASNLSSHVLKCEKSPNLGAWVNAGNRLEVWSWGKQGARGKRKIWTLKRSPIKLPEAS